MIKLKVHERVWKIYVLSGDKFFKKFRETADGFTLPDTGEIFFNEDSLRLNVVIHELVHAYYDSLCLSAATLNTDQQEEVFCELFAEYGAQILKNSRILYKELKNEVDN